MAVYTTIDDPEAYFQVKIYTGNGSTQTVTYDNTDADLDADFVWIKERTANDHELYDTVRGATARIYSNTTAAADTNSTGLTGFATDTFTLGGAGGTNNNTDTYVAWCWKANGSGSSNTDGGINTTSTSVSQTAGFSISKYTGGGANATVGHGLGAVPKVVIVKNLEATEHWVVYHEKNTSAPETDYLLLAESNATADGDTAWNDTAPTSSVFSVGTSPSVSGDTQALVAYCFAEKQGFSKFGSYTGNGSADGTFVYTGFRPAWVMIKRTDQTENWYLFDNKRPGYNESNEYLLANTSDAAGTNREIDLLSNGFKPRENATFANTSGGTYIYMAFAEAPFVNSNGVPCNAR